MHVKESYIPYRKDLRVGEKYLGLRPRQDDRSCGPVGCRGQWGMASAALRVWR